MKKIVLSVLIILLLVLVGCGRGPSEQWVEDDYHIGSRGVEMIFITNAPPYRIYEGDNLDVSVEVWNRGAFPQDKTFQGKLEISGFDPSSISGTWDGGNRIPTNLEGRSQYNIEGGYAVMSYRDRNGVHVPFDADYYEPRIIVHSCYEYTTVADPVVCIDPDPYALVEERKVCNVRNVQIGGGQGAPISVTNVEEEVGSDQIYFRIYISNSGGGSVMLPRAYNDCPFDVEIDELDKITAKVKLPHDASPECSPKGTASDPIRLTNGRGYIFCKFSKPATDSAYTTNLNIELDYVYSSSIEKQIKIINIK